MTGSGLRHPDFFRCLYEAVTLSYHLQKAQGAMVGKKLAIRLKPGSRAASFYGAAEIVESYYCNFGLNPEYREPLESAGLVISGWDDTDISPSADPRTAEARVLELPDHPFFLATLYVPQKASTPERPHPLIAAFCESMLA
jgi:CTP synthase (UTP-ammonia lyase)